MSCPCGSDEPYDGCCGRFHRGPDTAPTAEALMRSRYSAFVVGDAGYLLKTWHPSTRPATVEFDPAVQWRRLKVRNHTEDGDAATVDFVAHFWLSTQREYGRQQENSRFLREDGRWFYVDAA